MSEHTTTQCVLFSGIFDRPIVAQFDQSQGSSDGGAVLLEGCRPTVKCLTAALEACLKDKRQVGKVQHELDEFLHNASWPLPAATKMPMMLHD